MLRAYRKTFMGNIREQWQKLPDLRPALRVPVMLLVAPLLCCGFFPQFFVRMVAPTFRTSLSTNAGMQTCNHGAMRRPRAAAVTEGTALQARRHNDLATK